MRFLLLSLWLIAQPLFAAESIDFKNDREGESYYQTNANERAVNRAVRAVDGNKISESFKNSLTGISRNTVCAFDVIERFSEELKSINPRFNQTQGAIYYLRFQNEIDDSVAAILLKASDTLSTTVQFSKDDRSLLRLTRAFSQDGLELIKEFVEKNNTLCFDEAYKGLYSDLLKLNSNLRSHHLDTLFYEAYKRRDISEEVYVALEQARLNQLENSGITLKAYLQKMTSLRLQYPLRDPSERSHYVTNKVDKQKLSHRQSLIDNYSDIQIMLMGNVIKTLRERLDSPKVEILVYSRDDSVQETITLDAMERFRFAIRLLRKEMSYLSLNTYFAGRAPSYLDLMTAAFEIGIIPASELDELAGLQDIWNPEKTLWEKSRLWVQTLSTVATIAIPPPYGFLPALAVVVIEATTKKSKNGNENDPTSLF